MGEALTKSTKSRAVLFGAMAVAEVLKGAALNFRRRLAWNRGVIELAMVRAERNKVLLLMEGLGGVRRLRFW